MEKRIEVILNSKAGSAAADDLADTVARLFQDNGLSPVIHRVHGAEIGKKAVEAAQGDADIIVAGGGDGTICGVATQVSKYNKVLGVLPLAIAHGAGSGSQNSIGIGVMGGMISATVLGVFFIPLLFVSVRRIFKGKKATTSSAENPEVAPDTAH